MRKAIILKKIQVTMKIFAPRFFNHFSLTLNRKKTYGNESYEKEIKHIYASATDLLHTTIPDKIFGIKWSNPVKQDRK